jgi:hypothetical protein
MPNNNNNNNIESSFLLTYTTDALSMLSVYLTSTSTNNNEDTNKTFHLSFMFRLISLYLIITKSFPCKEFTKQPIEKGHHQQTQQQHYHSKHRHHFHLEQQQKHHHFKRHVLRGSEDITKSGRQDIFAYIFQCKKARAIPFFLQFGTLWESLKPLTASRPHKTTHSGVLCGLGGLLYLQPPFKATLLYLQPPFRATPSRKLHSVPKRKIMMKHRAPISTKGKFCTLSWTIRTTSSPAGLMREVEL